MEALNLLKFWTSAAARADVTDDEETDGEDSLFDLDFKSPDGGSDSRNDLQFIESPIDVHVPQSKNNRFSKSKPLSPVAILRSAPKFQVFMLGFRKSSRSDKAELNGETKEKSSKLDGSNSLRSKMMRENFDYETASDVGSREKSVPKYLKLIKPFYVKISNKVKSTDSATPSSSPVTAPLNLIGSFKIVTRNLGKSRSASVGVAPPSVRRRDDSLLEQNDGIQGAILHCKRSFNSSSQDYSRLFRATSDPSHEKLRAASRNSLEEQKRCSI